MGHYVAKKFSGMEWNEEMINGAGAAAPSRLHCFTPASPAVMCEPGFTKIEKRDFLEKNARNRFLENFTFDTMIQKYQIVYNSF